MTLYLKNEKPFKIITKYLKMMRNVLEIMTWYLKVMTQFIKIMTWYLKIVI